MSIQAAIYGRLGKDPVLSKTANDKDMARGTLAVDATGHNAQAEPADIRTGAARWRNGMFEHYCHCGEWGAFGHGVDTRVGNLGQWYCAKHRPERGES